MNLMALISEKDSKETSYDLLALGSEQSDPSISLAEYLWLDGEIIPNKNVHFHIPYIPSPESTVAGNEGIRCYATIDGPALFRLGENVQRFLNSARLLGVEDFPYDLDTLRDAICRLVYANNLNDCYVRPFIFFEGSPEKMRGEHEPTVAIAAWNWGVDPDSATLEPSSTQSFAAISQMYSFAGIAGDDFSEPYVNSIIARTLATRAGVEAAVTFNHDGFVNGCSADILLLVKNNKICTPPNVAMLKSLARSTVLTLAQDKGYEVVKAPVSSKQLYDADEIFVCSTFLEVMGVLEIDYLPVGDGHIGPVTHDLQQQYRAVVSGKDKRYREWLDYMVLEPII